ncbi:hypothetical protein IG631_12416 [Alternaria alternata]|nr:hypothetical protein IG631_12416 [Alternaria alternata]
MKSAVHIGARLRVCWWLFDRQPKDCDPCLTARGPPARLSRDEPEMCIGKSPRLPQLVPPVPDDTNKHGQRSANVAYIRREGLVDWRIFCSFHLFSVVGLSYTPSNSNGAAFKVPLHLNGLTLRAFGHQRVVRDQESDARFSGPWVGALLNNGGVPVQCILPLSPSAVHQENKRTVCVRRRESLTHVMLTTVYFNGETMLKTCRDRAANPCSLKI